MSDDSDSDVEDGGKDKKDKKKARKSPEETHTGSVEAADRAFAEWIAKQWMRGEVLQKIDIVEYFPKGAMKGFKEIVDWESFDKSRVDMEEAVRLSNRFVGSAQINCDRIHKKEMTYYVRAFDKGRTQADQAVDTFPLFLRPKTVYAEDRDSDDEVSAQSLSLDYTRDLVRSVQLDRQRDDANIGDVITMFIGQLREERQWSRELFGMLRETTKDWVAAIRDREAALSQEADRLPQREMTKIKAEMLRDGFRAGKNLLTGALGNMVGGDGGSKNGHQPQPQGQGQGQGQQQQQGGEELVVVTRMTHERMLLDNFFEDCKSAKLDIPLFGEWEKNESGIAKCVKPGIFTPEQFITLAKVLKGLATADALDDLIPANWLPENEGKPLTITMKQLSEAQAVEGMTEGIASSLIQLVTLRTRKKQEAAAAAATPATATAAATNTEETNV